MRGVISYLGDNLVKLLTGAKIIKHSLHRTTTSIAMLGAKRQLSQGSVDEDGELEVCLMGEGELTSDGHDRPAHPTSTLVDYAGWQ